MMMVICYKEHGRIPEPTGVINEIRKEQLISYHMQRHLLSDHNHGTLH